VDVHRLHATTGDGYLAALAGRRSNLPCRRTQETVAAHEKTGRRTGSVSDEVSAISHAILRWRVKVYSSPIRFSSADV
jgi:hypothetical protein